MCLCLCVFDILGLPSRSGSFRLQSIVQAEPMVATHTHAHKKPYKRVASGRPFVTVRQFLKFTFKPHCQYLTLSTFFSRLYWVFLSLIVVHLLSFDYSGPTIHSAALFVPGSRRVKWFATSLDTSAKDRIVTFLFCSIFSHPIQFTWSSHAGTKSIEAHFHIYSPVSYHRSVGCRRRRCCRTIVPAIRLLSGSISTHCA